jgi:hypothetical protein
MRYRLRTLLILLAGFAVALGIYRHRAEVQKEAVRSITRKGASVVYEGILLDAIPHSFYSEPVRYPNYPNWLTDTLGPDYVATVVSVSVSKDYRSRLRYERSWEVSQEPRVNPGYPDPDAADMIDVQDGTIQQLASLRSLAVLDLAETNVTDEDLEQLSRLKSLRHLRLGNCVTKRGVEGLQRLLPQATIEY